LYRDIVKLLKDTINGRTSMLHESKLSDSRINTFGTELNSISNLASPVRALSPFEVLDALAADLKKLLALLECQKLSAHGSGSWAILCDFARVYSAFLHNATYTATNAPPVDLTDCVSSADESRKTSLLTPRQRQVLELLVQGKSNKEIARSLKLGEGTVKVHVAALFRALGVMNRARAVALGMNLLNSQTSDIAPEITPRAIAADYRYSIGAAAPTAVQPVCD
jgi:DNA-binding CsgD family transcriptional regulator